MLKSFIKQVFSPNPPSSQRTTNYAAPCFSDENRLAKIQKLFPTIDLLYQKFAEEHHVPAYVLGVMVDGELIYTGNAGYADIEAKTPATTQTLFRIASMTKSFTALAILQLRDEGKLRLDDPVYLYIPEMKNQALSHDAPEITIRDLLSQSAGLPQDDPWADSQLDATDDELIAYIKQGISFSTVPGTAYEYSNLGYAMLGYIVNVASGMSYQNYVKQHIWMPLGMQDAAWEYNKIASQQLASGYRWMNETWVKQPLLHDGSFAAMGGMITSIESFSRYMALHMMAWPARNAPEPAPFKRSTLREMHQAVRFNAIESKPFACASAYGYGLKWFRDTNGNTFVGHSGGLPGFGSNWMFMPEHGIGVALFTNVTYAPTVEVNFHVLRTLVKEANLAPRQYPTSAVLSDRQKALLLFLPDWNNTESARIFAKNFFSDFPVNVLRDETIHAFEKIGEVTNIGDVIAENQLRGHFVIEGEKGKAKVSFTLSPESTPMIQHWKIEVV